MTLKDKKGTDYERAFYENTIKHHQAAIKMERVAVAAGRSIDGFAALGSCWACPEPSVSDVPQPGFSHGTRSYASR